MNKPGTDVNDVLIDCQSVWKVFGDKSAAAMQAIARAALSKTEVLREFDCVVGVSNASLQVRKGEIFCVMGLSGSGKSTLIRLLNRLIDASGGEIRIKGQNLMQLGAGPLRAMRAKHIGMVFQSVALLPHRSVLENAAFGLEVQGLAKPERLRIAAEALAKVGLSDWGHKYPRELSGGMQQRVGLAQAIAADPEIILMDEPFSALDPLIRRQLQDEFRQLAKQLGKSAVFITHDLDEAMRIGDRIAIMKDGVIVQTGTAADIVLNPANDYVAEFVAGISHLHLVTARTVMCPVADYRQGAPAVDLQALPRTGPDMDLDGLIGVMVDAAQHAIGVWDEGALLGVVTSRALLRSVQEKPARAAEVAWSMNYAQTIEAFDARVEDALNWLRDNAGFVFDAARALMDGFFNGTNALLSAPSPYLVMAAFAGLGLWLVGLRFAVLTGAGLWFCHFMGLWPDTMATLALVMASTLLALLIALPLGVWAGYHPRLDKLSEPLLDTLQTLPPYIYLLPAIALLGYGPATSLLATVLVAVAPALRLASLGIRMTPNEFIELGNANGISPLQMFFKIRLPFAVPSIMAGINQSLMMAFGMVVIAGIVGSGGLGQTIYEAVRTLNIARSIDATIAIVILTMVLDRLTQSAGARKSGGQA